MKNIFYYFILVIFLACNNDTNDSYIGNDYRIFKNTPAWNLAKAVRDENVVLIKKICLEHESLTDYQDPKFGKTLLMLAITNDNLKSVEALLDLGANPNIQNNYR